MNLTLLQVAGILGLAAVSGLVANWVHDIRDTGGYRELFVDESRYPNARECPALRNADRTRQLTYGERSPSDPELRNVSPSPGAGATSAISTPAESVDTTRTTPVEIAGDSASESEPKIVDGIEHIGVEAAKRALDDGVLFVDAREAKYYAEGHIPGAYSIPAYGARIEEKIQEISDNWGVSAPVIVYCNESEECEASHIVANQMKLFGFTDLRIYETGFPGWVRAKLPYVVGDEPGTLAEAIVPGTKEGE
ncbi:MAG TPA: rhodanese-like domain-containing protein [Planctomycetota bacterium]|nr:rhodanese-like domain-containing protein [Planctomycetota bacterium]